MKKAIKGIGIVLLVGIVAFVVFYLLGSTGVIKDLNPDLIFDQIVAGFANALNGIQASISGMFSNFVK